MIFDIGFKILLNALKINFRRTVMDVKQAIALAKEALLDLFADENPRSIRLEEVDLENSREWVVTLSYLKDVDPREEGGSQLGLMAIAAALNTNTRLYKKVVIDKSSGVVKSIKIHKNG